MACSKPTRPLWYLYYLFATPFNKSECVRRCEQFVQFRLNIGRGCGWITSKTVLYNATHNFFYTKWLHSYRLTNILFYALPEACVEWLCVSQVVVLLLYHVPPCDCRGSQQVSIDACANFLNKLACKPWMLLQTLKKPETTFET